MKSFSKYVVMLFLFCTIFTSELAGQLPSGTRDRVFHSTVDIYVEKSFTYETHGIDTVIAWGGSGNVISPDGWILTNAHIAFFDVSSFYELDFITQELYEILFLADIYLISYTSNPELPPQPLFYATVVEGEVYPPPDIALLKCRWHYDGTEISSDEDIFQDIHRLGDSDELEYGDEVYCVGYPDYAVGSISYTSGEVTNMVANEDRFGETVRYHIGTDAAISGGNSGGAAVNQDGELIGLPTMGLPGSGGWRGYITPINQAWWLLGKYVEEARMGASFNGRIVSAQTGEGIIGADIYILWPGVSVSDILALAQKNELTDDEYAMLSYSIFATCTSGIDGRFRLPHLLPTGFEYSIITFADYYEIYADQDCLDINRAGEKSITLEMYRQI